MIKDINKDIYKNAFTSINVSEKAINEVISKASPQQDVASHKRRKPFQILIPVVVILSLSIVTVSAATQTSISEIFKSFYNDIFDNNTVLNQSQQDFLEKYGVTPNYKFTENGINMDIEGIIGDRNFVYIKYSVSPKDEAILDSINMPELYIGKMTKGLLPASASVHSSLDKGQSYKINKAAIFDLHNSDSIAGKTATFVTKAPQVYQPINIDLSDIYKKHGVKALDNSDTDFNPIIYNFPNSNLNLPFDNKYGGKILLNSIGFVDGTLTLVIDSSNYYEIPEILLRNKKTNETYSRCDGVVSAERNNMEFYPYKLENTDILKDLEIVMPAEYHFSFPLSYTDSTKLIDLSKQSPLKFDNTIIKEIRISPISLNLYGISPNDGNLIKSCSIKLKDNTNLPIYNGLSSYGDYQNEDYNFHSGFIFPNPIMLDSMEAIMLEIGDEVVEVPVQ